MEDPMEEMNWGAVEDQLSGIQDVWKEPRFDTLPHVVAVLTSGYPQDDMGSLAKLRDTIEVLVDDVVQAYHQGFNKAIHNYSQILKLFSESAEQMSELKASLAEARRLLSNRHKQLQQLWCRSITLRHVISLIDQIDSVSKVPARIEQLVAEGQLYAAVQIHLQSISTLDREGISQIGALRDIRNELANTKLLLFNRVIEELHAHLYNKGQYSPKKEAATDDDDDISNLVPVAVPPAAPLHPSLAAQGISLPAPSKPSRSRGRSARAKGGLSVETGSAVSEDDDGTVSSPTRSEASAGASGPGEMVVRRHHVPPPKWLTEATSNEFVESLTKREAPEHDKYMQTLVECVALLGKVAAAGAVLSQRVRGSVREIMLNEIKEFATAAEAARPRVEHVSKRSQVPSTPQSASSTPSSHSAFSSSSGSRASSAYSLRSSTPHGIVDRAAPAGGGGVGGAGGGGGAVVGLHAPNGMAQVAAQELLESIMKKLTVILENHIVVGDLMEAKASDRSSDVRRTPDGDEAVSKFSASTGGYSVAFVWSCMQSECQQLLCDILRANPDGGLSETSGRNAHLKLDSAGSMKGMMLTFSFRFNDSNTASAPVSETLPKRRVGGMAAGAGALEGYGTAQLLPERGIYLTSACYRPTLQFTEKVTQMLPRKYSDLGRSGLRPFMDSFVKDQFLPCVRDDYRSRVAEALSSPSAFRPRAKTIGMYESAAEKGRPLLQGPVAVEGVVEEVLEWAKAMPVYAGDFVALVHTLLDRTLERCRGVYTEAVLGSLSSNLVGRPDIDELMQQQSAIKLILDGELTPAELEAAREDPPLDSEEYELDLEIYGKLLALRPIKEEQLILDTGKLVLLAALSDTLEYFADAILRLGRPKAAGSARKKTAAASARQQRAPALTASLQQLAERYRALAREALKTLRVEMQLHCIFHLQFMPSRGYVNEIDAEEPEDFIVALTAQLTRVDEEMTVFIAPARRYFVFGGVCSLAATGLIRALAELQGINSLGVRQVQRNCIALQQTLATLNANGSQSVQLSLDRVGEYYELLNRPYEALLAYIKDHNRYFSLDEYLTLLKVRVPGRHVPKDATETMKELLQEG
ncbi:hypothetical protein CLOM_g24381 [Closterium sp. NIES-68]|nr:hypothetical protein CLOM_g24381 [Closterium sp. NIES-68]